MITAKCGGALSCMDHLIMTGTSHPKQEEAYFPENLSPFNCGRSRNDTIE